MQQVARQRGRFYFLIVAALLLPNCKICVILGAVAVFSLRQIYIFCKMELMHTNYEISPHLRGMTHEQVSQLDQRATEGTSWEFYCGSYIHHPTVFGHKMSGMVQDAADEFFTEIRVDKDKLVAYCSCGEHNSVCKHAVALLYGWVEDNDGFMNVADTLDRLRRKDKDDLLEILGRVIMFDSRNLNFIDEDAMPDELTEEDL
ncbi:MAG: hypothetical protein ALAOOOJD_03886 [bacterium]|nr:hypothetical protein [bacterium]